MQLKIKLLDNYDRNLQTLPSYATAGAAGMDITSAEDYTFWPGDIHAVRTGIAIAIDYGWEGQIRPRSGLALNHGLTVLNSPGTIDSDYRGEIMVIMGMVQSEIESFKVNVGDRIAQLVIAPVGIVDDIDVVSELPPTARGAGGFGSTG